jgi:hypothetical protein
MTFADGDEQKSRTKIDAAKPVVLPIGYGEHCVIDPAV